jgi:hypothetical protein
MELLLLVLGSEQLIESLAQQDQDRLVAQEQRHSLGHQQDQDRLVDQE